MRGRNKLSAGNTAPNVGQPQATSLYPCSGAPKSTSLRICVKYKHLRESVCRLPTYIGLSSTLSSHSPKRQKGCTEGNSCSCQEAVANFQVACTEIVLQGSLGSALVVWAAVCRPHPSTRPTADATILYCTTSSRSLHAHPFQLGVSAFGCQADFMMDDDD